MTASFFKRLKPKRLARRARRIRKTALVASAALLIGAAGLAAAHDDGGPDRGGPDHGGSGTNSFTLSGQGVLYEGGVYDNPTNPTTMSGQMYVFFQIPEGYKWGGRNSKPPIIMIHGSQQTGANFLGTPDGRPGWAQFFVDHGWPVFVIDQPGRGKSGYFPNAYGPQAANPSPTTVQRMFTAPELSVPLQWPEARLHTQWPGGYGSGVPGEYAFDQFFASQVANMPNNDQALDLTTKAVTALIGKIGPSVIVTHSMSGPTSWKIPQANPGKIKAVIAVEPSGNSSLTPNAAPPAPCGLTVDECLNFSPPVSTPADLHLTFVPPPNSNFVGCWLQTGPIHKLTGLNGIPILIATGEASYHSTYDYCTSNFLTQAGVSNTHLYLASVGLHGNGHMEMLEMNNLQIADYYEKWLERYVH